MQQDRNKSRRPSSSIQQNSARRKEKPRKAYDWTQDRRPSNQDRRRTQGYQEQTLDFSGGNVTFENHSSGYADNSIQFPQQTALDHIFYSAQGTLLSANTAGDLTLSDHLALQAAIEFSV